jgi:hypothetical protein
MRKYAFSLFSLALLVLLFAPNRAVAQDQEDQDDPPSRVARLSFTRGAVSFQPGGTDDWVDATVNRPMTTGDKLWSDSGSRAAIHIGSASINLSENTGFSFLNLTDQVAQLQLTAGTIRVRVKRLGDDENFEIDTPNLAFTILRPGIYKISVDEGGDTTVIEDRKGEGEVTGGGSSYTLHAGDSGTFSGSDELDADVENIGDDEDDFDRWSEQRDHHEDNSISARYVSDDAIGYDDLDDNGGWRPTPEYGNVWFPRTVQTDWAPYHYGHWAYVAPWGYTWVDDAAWGFAPFHYGRWINVNGAWGWIPCAPRPVVAVGYGGPVYVRPVYAPALVAWVGGPGFGIGVGVGGGGGVAVGVGWFPLGPREVFVPSYHVSRAYVNNVNVSNTTVNTTVVNNYYNTVIVNKTTVNNVTYVNQRVPGAVVATNAQAFSSGQSVSKNIVHVDARVVASAPVNNVTPAAVPQREAVLGGRAAVTVRPPAAVQARAVVAKTAPPPPPPAFAQRQQAIQANGGRPISMAQARQIAPVRAQGTAAAPAPQVRVAPPAKQATPQVVNGSRNAPPPVGVAHPAKAQNNAPAVNNNRPPAQQPAVNNNAPQPVNNNRPPAQQPAVNNNSQPANNNRAPQPAANNNQRPPTAHPADEELEKQHQQQSENLQKQQDQERQRVEQQQQKENQDAQKQKADAAKQQQLQQQHEQQLQEQQKQHQQQQQQLQEKQEQEHKDAQKQQQPKDKDKDKQKPKDDRPPKKDQN